MFLKALFQACSSSHLLEDFLDYHGAKNNSRWYFYRENDSKHKAPFTGRICTATYNEQDSLYGLGDVSEFVEGYKTLSFIKSCISGLAPSILAEASNLEIALPEDHYDRYDFTSFLTGEKLESDIDAEDRERQKDHIVKITSEFF